MRSPDEEKTQGDNQGSQIIPKITIQLPFSHAHQRRNSKRKNSVFSPKLADKSDISIDNDSNPGTPLGRSPLQSRKNSIEIDFKDYQHDVTPMMRKSTFHLNPTQKKITREPKRHLSNFNEEPSRRKTIYDGRVPDMNKIKSLMKLDGIKTPLQGKIIMQHLIEANGFFKSLLEGEEPLDTDSLISICRNIKFKEYPHGKVIMQEGDDPDGNIYVIYSGEAVVIKKKMTVIMEQNIKQRRELRKEKSERSVLKIDSSYRDDSIKIEPLKTPEIPAQRQSAVTKAMGNILNTNSNNASPQRRGGLLERRSRDSSNLKIATEIIEIGEKAITPRYSQRGSIGPRSTLSPRTSSNTEALDPTRPATPKKKALDSVPKILTHRPVLSRNSSLRSMMRSPLEDSFTSQARSPRHNDTLLSDDEDHDKIQHKVQAKAAKYGNILDSVYPGSVFGELALSMGQKRGATIMTATNMELIIIKAQDYHLIKARNDGKRKRIVDFMLRKIPDLEIYGQQVTENLYYALKEIKVPFGTHLFFEGNPSETIFLIYNGEIQLSKSLVIEEKPTGAGTFDQNISPHIRLKPQYRDEIDVCTISDGCFFGEECLQSRENHYFYTAKVLSQPGAIIYKCDRSKFLLRFPVNTVNTLQSTFDQKEVERFNILKIRLHQKYRDYHINFDHLMKGEDPLRYPIHLKSYENRSINMKLKLRLFETSPKREKSPPPQLSKENSDLIKSKIQATKIPHLTLPPKPNMETFMLKSLTERANHPRSRFFSKLASKLPIKAQEIISKPPDFKPLPPTENQLNDDYGYFRSLSVKRQVERQEQTVKKTAHFFVPLLAEKNFKPEGKGPIRHFEPEENYLERLSVSIKKINEAKPIETKPIEKIDDFKIGIHEKTKEEEMRTSYYKKKIRRDLGIDPKEKGQPFQTHRNIESRLRRVKRNAVKSVIDPGLFEALTARNSSAESPSNEEDRNLEEIYNFIYTSKQPKDGMIKKGRLKSLIPTPTEAIDTPDAITICSSVKNQKSSQETMILKDLSHLSHGERIKLKFRRNMMLKTPRLKSMGEIELKQEYTQTPMILTDSSPKVIYHHPSKSVFHSRSETMNKKLPS